MKKACGTTDAFFDGIIDEVYLWDRVGGARGSFGHWL
jgi:hypothetical protein